jgi:hypothetical protein
MESHMPRNVPRKPTAPPGNIFWAAKAAQTVKAKRAPAAKLPTSKEELDAILPPEDDDGV